jgi:competence protein ComEC
VRGADPSTGTPSRTFLDARLLVPAMLAWAGAAGLAGRSPAETAVVWGLAALALLVSCAMVVAQRRRSRNGAQHGHRDPLAMTPSWAATAALSAAAVVLVLTCAQAGHQVETSGPLPALAREQAVVQVQGVVTTQPRMLAPGPGGEPRVVLRLRLERLSARGATSRPSAPVLVFADGQWQDVPWRAVVSTTGRLSLPRDTAGQVDTAADVTAVLSPRGSPVLERAPPTLLRLADAVRARLRAAVAPLPVDARALIPGLVIGDTSLTPPDLTEDMLETGMSHLSAVSGSNVAIVLASVVLVCRATGVPRRGRAPLAALALVAFVLLCRPEPSVLRAGVMGLVGLAGLSASRRTSTLPALACAVIVLLCVDPHLARSYGFALSVLATVGLVFFARPWGDAIAARLPARMAVLGPAVAIPLAAQLACAPVIVLLQGDIAVVAVLANLLAAPVVAVTTVVGVSAALAACVWVPLGTAVAALAVPSAWWIGAVARGCAALPGGHVEWLDGPLGAWSLATLSVLGVLTGPWMFARLRGHPGMVALVVAGTVAALVPLPVGSRWPPPSGWTLVACDVGQGDAFVMPAGEAHAGVAVDVGPPEAGVVSCLQDLGVTRLEVLVLSHFHRDHVGALEEVLTDVKVEQAYVSPVQDPPQEARRALRALRQAGVPTYTALGGTRLSWSGGSMRVVWPVSDRAVASDSPANNASLVLDVTTGPTRVLFTGDIEQEAAGSVERLLRGRRFDVLKVAHHGSADQDEDLVRGSGARLALIGVGADNPFGHPTTGTLALLRRSGMLTRRTDVHGHVAVVPSRGGLSVLTAADRESPSAETTDWPW